MSGAPPATTPVERGSATPASNAGDRPLVRTRNLTKEYEEIVAVDRLTFEVRPGEIFGLLGQNGAGKTTTILMLLGLTEPTSGEARVVGLDPARHPLEVKRRVGYLPDSVGFYGDLTGRQNLRYTARLNGMDRRDAEPRIDEVIEQVDLVERADTRTDTYSRGMLQRLGIADALLKDPAVLILDEPTTAIDPIGVVEILDLLRRLVRERRLAVLLSSHLLGQVQSVCDRIGIFASGRLIGQGTLAELARQFGEEAAEVVVGVETDGAGDSEAIEQMLTGLPGVAGAARVPSTADHEWTWHVRVATNATEPDVRARILAALSERGLRLADLTRRPPSLDDIYRRAVERAKADRASRRAEADREAALAGAADQAVRKGGDLRAAVGAGDARSQTRAPMPSRVRSARELRQRREGAKPNPSAPTTPAAQTEPAGPSEPKAEDGGDR